MVDADKFHANCYSYSGAVMTMHYPLRQKPYRVMWSGNYVELDHDLKYFSRFEDLLGLSTYHYDFDKYKDIENKKIRNEIKFIEASSRMWERINVEIDELKKYFNLTYPQSIKYSGYLVNHTQELAINLADYYEKSKGVKRSGLIRNGSRIPGRVGISYYDGKGVLKSSMTMAIDPIPVLTETGGGTGMALYNGISADTTEKLSQNWRGDLLEIVNKPPKNYEMVECCFATLWERAIYCHHTFGVNQNNLLIKDNNGSLFESVELDLFGNRESPVHIKVEAEGNETIFKFAGRYGEVSFSFDNEK